jgi:hypothetical protein
MKPFEDKVSVDTGKTNGQTLVQLKSGERSVAQDYLDSSRGIRQTSNSIIDPSEQTPSKANKNDLQKVQAREEKKQESQEKTSSNAEQLVLEKRQALKENLSASRTKITEIEQRLDELNKSWNVFRHLSSEKDGLKKWLERERELLNTQESISKKFEEGLGRLEESNKASGSSSSVNTKFDLIQSIEKEAKSAQKNYEQRATHEKPRNAFQTFRDEAHLVFTESLPGRVVIGIGTVVATVGSKIKEGVVAAVSSVPALADKIAGKASKFLDWITDPETLKSLGRGISAVCKFVFSPENWLKLGKAIVDINVKAWKYVLDGDNWQALLGHISKGFGAAVEYASNIDNWKNLGANILKGVTKFVSGIGELTMLTLQLLSDPKRVLNLLNEGVKLIGQLLTDPVAAFHKICKGLTELGDFVSDKLGLGAIWKIHKAVFSFVKSLADTFGISDLLAGVANLLASPIKLIVDIFKAIGDGAKLFLDFVMGKITLEQLQQGIGAAVSMIGAAIINPVKQIAKIVGAVVHLVFEMTGIADLGRAIGYALIGDWKNAGIHFGLALVDLTAIAIAVVTGGAGLALYAGIAALRKGMLKAALQHAGKAMLIVGGQVGRDAAEEVIEKIGMKTLKNQASEVAEHLYKEMGEKALRLDQVEAFARSSTHELFGATLKKDLGEAVENILFKRLSDIVDNPKAFKKELVEILGKKEGTKAYNNAISMLQSGKHFDELAKPLAKEISDQVYKKLAPELEEAFATRFKQLLVSDVDPRIAKRLADEATERGISKAQLVDEYVDAGRTGFRQGLKDAIDEIVEAAVKRALKRLRLKLQNQSPLLISNSSQASIKNKTTATLAAPAVAEERNKGPSITLDSRKSNLVEPAGLQMKFRNRVVNIGTQQVKITEELLPDGKWHVVGREEVEARQEANKKTEEEINTARTIMAAKPMTGLNGKKEVA